MPNLYTMENTRTVIKNGTHEAESLNVVENVETKCDSKESSPNVTVVIPFFSNRKGILGRAIHSVIRQTYQDFEIIVVDDCSPLDAFGELKNIHDSRIGVIKNTKNMNGAYSRNKGIRKAKGKFIALLDADDYYLPNHLRNCIENIENNDFIYSNIVWYVNGKANYKTTSLIKNYNKKNICDILLDSPPQTNSFFFRKKCFPQVRFNESLNRHQDYQFFIDFSTSNFKVKKIDSFTACYIPVNSGKIVDYNSIIDYWIENKGRVSKKKLHIFMMGVSSSITRKKEYDFALLEKINNEICQDLVLKLILLVESKTLARYSLYFYYNFVLDINKILPKIRRKLLKVLRLSSSNDAMEL